MEILRPNHYIRFCLLHTSPHENDQILQIVKCTFQGIILAVPMHLIDPEIEGVISIDVFVASSYSSNFKRLKIRQQIRALNLPIDWDEELERWNHEELTDYLKRNEEFQVTKVVQITPFSIELLDT